MNEEIQILQTLGAQKIYEKTHIPIKYVEAILSSDFDVFSRVQLLGFISILEREFKQDFPMTKEAAESFFAEKDKTLSDASLFVTPEKKRSNAYLYIPIAIIVLILFFIFNNSASKSQNKNVKVDNKLIENVEHTIDPKVIDGNTTESNVTDASDSNLSTPVKLTSSTHIEKVKAVTSLKIIAKPKVWMGYINIKTNVKKQKSFKGEFDLDPSQSWLLVFGHGYIDIYIDGKIQKFNSRNIVHFAYQNGKLRAVTKEEFKKLNRGRSW